MLISGNGGKKMGFGATNLVVSNLDLGLRNLNLSRPLHFGCKALDLQPPFKIWVVVKIMVPFWVP